MDENLGNITTKQISTNLNKQFDLKKIKEQTENIFSVPNMFLHDFCKNVTLLNPNSNKINIIDDLIFSISTTSNFLREYSFARTPTTLTPDRQGIYSNLRVAVIDDFDNAELELLNFSHGEIVQKFIKENLPGVQIEEKNCIFNGNDIESLESVLVQLTDILHEIEQGKQYDAINISLELLQEINTINFNVKSDNKEIRITNNNINQYRNKLEELYKEKYPKIKKILNFINLNKDQEIIEEETNKLITTATKISEMMKKISKKNVKIFLSNNNRCKDTICFSDLIDLDSDYDNYNNPNIITVSANDCNKRSTTLSDIKEQSIYKFKFLKEGIDITGDGIVDIYDKYDVKSFVKEYLNIDSFEGNSFATPVALAKYLKMKNIQTKFEEQKK